MKKKITKNSKSQNSNFTGRISFRIDKLDYIELEKVLDEYKEVIDEKLTISDLIRILIKTQLLFPRTLLKDASEKLWYGFCFSLCRDEYLTNMIEDENELSYFMNVHGAGFASKTFDSPVFFYPLLSLKEQFENTNLFYSKNEPHISNMNRFFNYACEDITKWITLYCSEKTKQHDLPRELRLNRVLFLLGLSYFINKNNKDEIDRLQKELFFFMGKKEENEILEKIINYFGGKETIGKKFYEVMNLDWENRPENILDFEYELDSVPRLTDKDKEENDENDGNT